MALIAIPVGGTAEFGSAFRAAFRALTFSAPDALAREPFIVLAARTDGWGTELRDQVFVDRGLMLLSDGSLAERIHDGINAIDAQRLRAQYENRAFQTDAPLAASEARTPTVIAPVLRVTGESDLERLSETAAAVDAALELVSTRLVRRELSASAFAFVPWIHIEPPLAKAPPTAGFFTGPQRIRGGKAVPVLSVSTASSQWQERGRVRLIADLLALYGFSRRRDAAAWLSPAAWADRDAFHTFVTSFVELPMSRARRRHVLRQLEVNLKEVSEPDGAELHRRAEDATQSLNTLIRQDDVPVEAFISNGRPLGISTEMSPGRDDFLSIDATRRVDDLHNRTVNAVRDGIAGRMKDAANVALARFRRQLQDDEIALEAQVRSVLGEPGLSIGNAVAAATRFADLLPLALDKPVPATGSFGVDQVLQQAIARRGAWISEEEALWRKGSRLPSGTAIVTSSLLILLGSTTLALLILDVLRELGAHTAVLIIVTTLAATAPPGLYAWFRLQFVKEYIAEWQRFEERLRGEILAFAQNLRDIANRRLKALKMASLPSLERAIHAVKIRLRTELRGLASLIRDELESAEDEEPARPVDGWFRLPTEVVQATITDAALADVRNFLLEVVKLREWPQPQQIPKIGEGGKVRSHLDALDKAVLTPTTSEEHDSAAAGALIGAVIEYAKDPQVALDLDDDRTFGSLREATLYAFSPENLRAAVDAHLRAGGAIEPFVPELVVAATVRSHHVIRRDESEATDIDNEMSELET